MKLASRSAIESESSAKADSSDSRGKLEVEVPGVNVWLPRREVRDEGRSGVDGREGGLERVTDVDRLEAEYSISMRGLKIGNQELSRTFVQPKSLCKSANSPISRVSQARASQSINCYRMHLDARQLPLMICCMWDPLKTSHVSRIDSGFKA